MTTNKSILTREAILQAKDYKVEEVEMPEWGGTIRLRSLTGKGRDEFEAAVTASSAPGQNVDIRGLKALLITMTVVDENDELVFTKDDIDVVNSKSSETIERLWNIIQKMNSIGDEGIQGAEKNSQSDRSASSGSGSQDN